MSDSLTPTNFDFISRPEVQEEEKVWCKIGPDGELELFDWDYVEKMAREYDMLGPVAQKNNVHIICKLSTLIRKQTLEKAADVIIKCKDVSAEASTIVIKDPLGEA